MSSRPTIPRGLVPSPTEDQFNILTRPQPAPSHNKSVQQPPPSSLPNSYDIPSLRRKPQTDHSEPSPGRHSRSFSHPFPSFFGSRKPDKRVNDRSNNADGKGQDVLTGQMDGAASKPLQTGPQNAAAAKSNRQPVTGKCMTCASTVRWPQDLKVYRCTTCLTINDLEPYDTQTIPESGVRNASARKPLPISLDKTRILVDHCLNEYMRRLLEIEGGPSEPKDILQESSFVSDDEGTETFPNQPKESRQEPGLLPPSRPRFQDRSPSDSQLSAVRSRPREVPPIRSISPGPMDLHSSKSVDDVSQKTEAQIHRPNHVSDGIFRTVESYIAGCYTGCTALNLSFLSMQPHPPPAEERHSRKTHSKRHPTDPNSTPASESDVYISELDAKMLLVGDVAENGSWWTGNQRLEDEAQTETVRERSPDRSHGVVNAKSPRINWMELAEWYRIIVHAGDDWRQKWHAMRPPQSHPLHRKWHSIPMEHLQRDIIESQIHLQRSLLKSTENLLKRPRRPLRSPDDCRFLLMLLANPLIHPSSNRGIGRSMSQSSSSRSHGTKSMSPAKSNPNPPTRKTSGALGQHSGIIKRVFGLIANLSNEIHIYLASWFARLSDSHFQRLVELVSGFVTYRLTRQFSKPVKEMVDPTAGLIPSFNDTSVRHASQLHAAIGGRSNPSQSKKQDNKPKIGVYSEDWQIRVAARVMALLFQANSGHTARKRDSSISPQQRLQSAGLSAKHHAHVRGQMIPISNFYNTMLDSADLVTDFETWETTKTKFTFCQYPFFLSIWAKIHVLEHDARRQMESKAREAFFDSILSRKAVSQYLVLKVRRDCLVEDSLKNVSEVIGRGDSDIKKGLRIDFTGEEGVDAGGLRKEWFLLLVREIFNPHHGLFVYDEDSQYCYFNPFCFESSEQFFLVGVLLGLAIYNSTILDIAFPPFVFKKMLASAPANMDKLTSTPKIIHHCTLEDLAEFRPSLARGLRQLLDFDGSVQEVFCRDFVAEMDRYGEVVQVPLCPGGSKRPVTNSNRREFVDLYVRYLLDTAVARQYEPFKRGFFTVCGGNALSLFRPEEIELLVRGSDEPLDVSSLRAVAAYDGWPKGEPAEEQPQVVWFWEFFQHANPVDQRKLLSFITGSDRIPAMGATNLNIRIQLLLDRYAEETGDEPQRFPIARTCFNQLGLYQYHHRETLEHKLWMAVTGSEGFGLK